MLFCRPNGPRYTLYSRGTITSAHLVRTNERCERVREILHARSAWFSHNKGWGERRFCLATREKGVEGGSIEKRDADRRNGWNVCCANPRWREDERFEGMFSLMMFSWNPFLFFFMDNKRDPGRFDANSITPRYEYEILNNKSNYTLRNNDRQSWNNHF